MTALNNVAVTAYDSSDVTQISGGLSVSFAPGAGPAVGVAFGVNNIDKTTAAFIDTAAQVTANAQGTGLVALTGETTAGLGFTASAIAGNQITLLNHGLQNGQAVVYNAPDSSSSDAIGGLVNGQTYYVKVIDANTISLMVSANASTVVTLTPPSNGQALQALLVIASGGSVGSQVFETSVVSGSTITAAGHGFVTGQQVLYSATNQPIDGLQSGQLYYVIGIDANHFPARDQRRECRGGTFIVLSTAGLDPTSSQTIAALSDPVQTASNADVGLTTTQSFTRPADRRSPPPRRA